LKSPFSKHAFYVLKTAMKKQGSLKCPDCGSSNTSVFKRYSTIHNGIRQLFICKELLRCSKGQKSKKSFRDLGMIGAQCRIPEITE
jgi:hypothetical protein